MDLSYYGHLDVDVLDDGTAFKDTRHGSAKVDQMDNLEQVAELIRNCDDCSLSQGRINPVPGGGNPHAPVMFIGEGPGLQEDRQGLPFVGAAGKLLDSL